MENSYLRLVSILLIKSVGDVQEVRLFAVPVSEMKLT